MFGPSLVQVWFKTGLNMVQVWFKSASCLVPTPTPALTGIPTPTATTTPACVDSIPRLCRSYEFVLLLIPTACTYSNYFCTLLLHGLLTHLLTYLATQFQWPKTFCIMERRIMLSLFNGTEVPGTWGKADSQSWLSSHGRRISCQAAGTSDDSPSSRGPCTGTSRMSALKSFTGRVRIERENEGESDEQRQTKHRQAEQTSRPGKTDRP